jgi:DNA repair protein RecO (recombination protein O)
MIYKTRGIVFRTVKYSESSVICKIYTEKFGLRSYIINSVRSAKAKTKAALLQPMSLLEMDVYHHEQRNLNRIKELRLFCSFNKIWFYPLKSSVGMFMMEVLNKSIHEEEVNEKMFDFITNKLIETDECEEISNDFLLKFLLQLSLLLGFFPNGKHSTPVFDLMEGNFVADSSNHQHYISPVLAQQFSDLLHKEKTEFTATTRRNLMRALLEYYQLHVPNFTKLKSLAVLEEVFK